MINIIVLWQTVYIQAALDHLAANGHPLDPADIARLSPLGHPTINLDGRYRRGAGNNGVMNRIRPSSFPERPWCALWHGWSLAWPERVVDVAGPLAALAALVSLGPPSIPSPLQLGSL